MSPTESELRSYFQTEAGQVDARGSMADAVFAAKRRSDRRRAGGLAALTVIAVAAPLAWASLTGAPAPTVPGIPPSTVSSTGPTPTASSPTPTPAPTVTSRMEDAQVTARPALNDPSQIRSPGVPYAASGIIRDDVLAPTTPEPSAEDPLAGIYETTVTAPVGGGFPTFQRLEQGRFLVQATSGTDQRVHIVSGLGTSTVLEGAQHAVVSADGRRIAWTDGTAINHAGEGVIHIADSTGAESTTVKVDATPTALVGDILYAIEVLGYEYAGQSVRINLSTGDRTDFKGNVVAVNAASGLAIVTDLFVDGEPEKPRDLCYRLVDTLSTDLPTRLRACGDVIPFAFSPDGRYLLARGGDDGIFVVDALDGRILLDAIGSSGLRPQSARITDDGWALVMSVLTADMRRSGLVRCTFTGECEQVGGPSIEEPAPDDADSPRIAYGLAIN